MEKHCNNSQCFKEKNNKTNTKKREKIMLETLQQFTVFCDESYSASPHDLALFVMTCNCNSQTTQY